MKCARKPNAFTAARTWLKLLVLGVASLTAGISHAAFITGNMGLTGSFEATGGTDLSDATGISLTTVTGTSGDGVLGTTVDFGTTGVVNNGSFAFNPPDPGVVNLLEIGGWQVDLSVISLVDQTPSILTMQGTGAVSGNGFDLTPTIWTFSANAVGSSYSMTVSAVPLPAAVWLFGSGLIGLAVIARRKLS